jgi:predicted SAM-dependent methyltransferase
MEKENTVKLNLGCGEDVRPGYVNADIRRIDGVAVVCDMKALPFRDGSLEEITARDVIEHVSWRKVPGMVREWRRALRPFGRLILQTPDLEGLLRLYREQCEGWRREDGDDKGVDPIVERLYGGQDYEGNFHHVAFDKYTLQALLERESFRVIEVTPMGRDVSNLCATAVKVEEADTREDGLAGETSSEEVQSIRVTWEAHSFGAAPVTVQARNAVLGLDDLGVKVKPKPVWGDCPMEFETPDAQQGEGGRNHA